MAHGARTDFAVLLGSLFLVIVGRARVTEARFKNPAATDDQYEHEIPL